MKYHFLATVALAGMVSTAAHAATVAQNYEEAKAKAGDNGFVLVLYPDGWNKKAADLGQSILASDEVGNAAGDAVMMGVAIPDISTKEVQAARSAKLGPLQLDLGRAQSYPAIYMYEGPRQSGTAHRCYAVIPAHEFRVPGKPEASVSGAAGLIAARLAAIKEQRTLMAQADTQQGKEKLDTICKAVQLPGISRPDKVADIVKKADPQDEHGLQAALAFDWAKLVWTSVKEDWKKAVERCETMIANPYLSPQQKQLAYLCAMGAYRRNAGAEGLEKMRQFGQEMRQLDPQSRWGRSYDGAMRMWDVRFSLECGWCPATLPAADEPAECEGPWPIAEKGTYKITFSYSGGSHALQLSKVELYDGITKVTEDAHPCTAGHKQVDNVYTLRVTSPVIKPRIVVTTNMGEKRNSSGSISITKE